MTYHENVSEPSYSIARKNPESNSTFNKMVKAEMKKQPAKKCETCGLVCKSKLFHDRHVYTAHAVQVPQTCKICQDVVPDPKALLEHKRNQHSSDMCFICGKSFLHLATLNNHILVFHPEDSASLKTVNTQGYE